MRLEGVGRLLTDSRAQPSLFALTLSGLGRADTSGGRSGVRINTASQMRFDVVKWFKFDERGFAAWPATADVEVVASRLKSIHSQRGVGSRLKRRVAAKEYARTKDQATAIMTVRSRRRLAEKFDAQATAQLSELQGDFVRLQNTLADWGTPLTSLRPRIGQGRCWIDATLATADVAQSDGDAQAAEADLVVSMQTVVVNTIARSSLGGRTLSDVEMRRRQEELLRRFGAGASGPRVESTTPWAVTFAASPLRLSGEADVIRVSMHSDRFESNGRMFPDPMTVQAEYRFIPGQGSVTARREGQIVVYPSDFPPGRGPIPGRLLMQRTIMRRRLEVMFPAEFHLHSNVAERSPVPLTLAAVRTRGKWLQIDFRRALAPANGAAAAAQ
jgi:hypothetical protein